jgi:hypothetical protein
MPQDTLISIIKAFEQNTDCFYHCCKAYQIKQAVDMLFAI